MLGSRRVDCAPGVPMLVVRSHWSNIPTQYTVSVDPPETVGTWIERSSYVPAGLAMSNRSAGQITAQMRFRRKYLDSSFEIVVTTDRPAQLAVRRS